MAELLFEGALRERGLRVTDERRTAYRVLQNAHRPLTRTELVEALREEGIGTATAYRTVSTFQELGIVQPVMMGSEVAYELLPPYASHHHHFHCLRCGKIFEVRVGDCDGLVPESVPGVVVYHQVEAYGICDRCLLTEAEAPLPGGDQGR
jgi:Fe2+ or Zn2+ uptake regulation protein